MADIVCVNITPNIYQEAESRNQIYYKKFGNSGTHRNDRDNQRMTGYLAEACIRSIFPVIKYSPDYSVDFIYDKITIDSKSQGCNSAPLAYYSATLYEEQKNRAVDYYIFSRVKNDFTKCWICGIISKRKFFNIATLKIAGTVTNNFVYDESRYEIQYKDLGNITQFIQWYNSYVIKNQTTTI